MDPRRLALYDLIDRPHWTLAEAARLLGVPDRTARRWKSARERSRSTLADQGARYRDRVRSLRTA